MPLPALKTTLFCPLSPEAFLLTGEGKGNDSSYLKTRKNKQKSAISKSPKL
jgi:hypothetical protein